MKKMIWLLFLATTTTFAFAQHHRQGRDGRGNHKERLEQRERFEEALNLTDEQQEAIDALRLSHQKAVKEDQDELRLLMVQLRNETTDNEPNRSEIDRLTTDIGTLQTSLMKARINHQIDVREELDEDQKLKFDRMHRKHRNGRGRF